MFLKKGAWSESHGEISHLLAGLQDLNVMLNLADA